MRLEVQTILWLIALRAGAHGYVRPDIGLDHIHNRIVSGSPAARGQFPWQVILKLDPLDDLHCGGSIIAPTWVLTAAHCTYGFNSMFLMFGTVIFDNPYTLNMTSNQLYIHPQYNDATLNNDVSLILLPTQLKFSKTIQAIELVSSTYANYNFIGQMALIAGFGLTDDEYTDFSNSLLYAQVEIINNSYCAAIYESNVVISSTMCAKGKNGTNMSICSGDSGGPLITQNNNGKWIQIGINSFVAMDMCTAGYPSGYARLTSFLNYISQVTGIPFSSV